MESGLDEGFGTSVEAHFLNIAEAVEKNDSWNIIHIGGFEKLISTFQIFRNELNVPPVLNARPLPQRSTI
jgi:hypothetical protein